ncbi:transglycosylase SLT domain-containing protein [Nitrospirota bacterium]
MLFCLIDVPAAIASELVGRDHFKAGLILMDEGQPQHAVKGFQQAKENLIIAKDYTMYYLAMAFEESGESRKAVKELEQLLKDFPRSPLKQKSQRMRILLLRDLDDPGAFKALHNYLRFHPTDLEVHFLYGQMLKERGKNKIAEKIFLHIYANASDYSEQAREQLGDARISGKVLKKRAENFMARHEYAKAEPILKALIDDAILPVNEELIKDYARSLFRQRKYTEAAVQYLLVEDRYNAARAFLRSGRKIKFYSILDDMVQYSDEKAATLLIACAEDARRSGDTADAIEILTEAITKFPDSNEDALWSKGWLYYRTRDYANAVEVFKSLYKEHEDNRYLYWLARSVEKSDGDPSPLYNKLNGDDYYSYLAHLLSNSPIAIKEINDTNSNRVIDFQRVDFLLEVGLLEYASMELEMISHRVQYYSEYIQVAKKMNQARQYKRAMGLLEMVPDDIRPQGILYPMAFWDTVEDIASLYDLDPFLMLSLIREESHFDSDAFSAAGAIGLMQLMPSTARSTAKRLDMQIKDREDISDVENNIRIGTHYFSGLLVKFDSIPPALAAYNAGERRVKNWLRAGGYASYDEFIEDIPYKETRNYVKRILKTYYRYKLSDSRASGQRHHRIL